MSAEAEPTSVAGIDEEIETMNAIRLIQTLEEALNNEKASEKIFLGQNVEDDGKYHTNSTVVYSKNM